MMKDYLNYVSETLGVRYLKIDPKAMAFESDSEIQIKSGTFDSAVSPIISQEQSLAQGQVLVQTQVTLSNQPQWEKGYSPDEKHQILFLLNYQEWGALSPNEKELFHKVRAAIKLPIHQTAPAVMDAWDKTLVKNFLQSRMHLSEYVWFIDDLNFLQQSPQRLEFAHRAVLLIPSLKLMLQNPEHKKMAWERLKMLMLKLHLK